MKQNIQQRPILHLGETSIKIHVRKYDPKLEYTEMISKLPIFQQHDGYQFVLKRLGQYNVTTW